MKCLECGGRLEGPMTFCPFCGVRPDVDLRQIHFRDLGVMEALSCPQCTTDLHTLEFDFQPPLRIERCHFCTGLFFNPGELEVLLEGQTNSVIWFDSLQLNQIATDWERPREVAYRKCPVCTHRMNHVNFGGRSGVVVDHCAAHGLWLEGGHLRRLTEWWRAGGKALYQQHQVEKVRSLHAPLPKPRRPAMTGTTESPTAGDGGTWSAPCCPVDPIWGLFEVIASLLSSDA